MQDLLFASINNCFVVIRQAGEIAINSIEGLLVLGVDKKSIHLVQEIVPGSAGDGPIARQGFVASEDFFCDNVEGSFSKEAETWVYLRGRGRLPLALRVFSLSSFGGEGGGEEVP